MVAHIGALGVALHEVNYALYRASISTVVLTWLGLPHPTSLTTNWERVAWTVAGVGIALCVTLVAGWTHTWRSQRAARAEWTPTTPTTCRALTVGVLRRSCKRASLTCFPGLVHG